MADWEGLEKAIESEILEYTSERKLFTEIGVDNCKGQMSKIDYEARISLYRRAIKILTLIDTFSLEFPDLSQYKEMSGLISKLVESHETVFIQEGLNSIILERQIENYREAVEHYKKAIADYESALKLLLVKHSEKSI